jgi:hypothetical protein
MACNELKIPLKWRENDCVVTSREDHWIIRLRSARWPESMSNTSRQLYRKHSIIKQSIKSEAVRRRLTKRGYKILDYQTEKSCDGLTAGQTWARKSIQATPARRNIGRDSPCDKSYTSLRQQLRFELDFMDNLKNSLKGEVIIKYKAAKLTPPNLNGQKLWLWRSRWAPNNLTCPHRETLTCESGRALEQIASENKCDDDRRLANVSASRKRRVIIETSDSRYPVGWVVKQQKYRA